MVSEVELHDEIKEWLEILDDDSWDRLQAIVDHLAALVPSANAVVEKPRRRFVRTSLHPRADGTTHHLPLHLDRRDCVANHISQTTRQRTSTNQPSPQSRSRPRPTQSIGDMTMANYSRWDEIKKQRRPTSPSTARRRRTRPRPRPTHLRPPQPSGPQPARTRGAHGHHPISHLPPRRRRRRPQPPRHPRPRRRRTRTTPRRLLPRKPPTNLKDAVQAA